VGPKKLFTTTCAPNNDLVKQQGSREFQIANTRSNQKSTKSKRYLMISPIQNKANVGWGFQANELQLGKTQQQVVEQPSNSTIIRRVEAWNNDDFKIQKEQSPLSKDNLVTYW
jgi:hypothetical protein